MQSFLALKLHIERFKEPCVIVGMVLFVVSIALVFASDTIALRISSKKFRNEESSNEKHDSYVKKIKLSIKGIGLLIAIVGAFVAVLGIN